MSSILSNLPLRSPELSTPVGKRHSAGRIGNHRDELASGGTVRLGSWLLGAAAGRPSPYRQHHLVKEARCSYSTGGITAWWSCAGGGRRPLELVLSEQRPSFSFFRESERAGHGVTRGSHLRPRVGDSKARSDSRGVG